MPDGRDRKRVLVVDDAALIRLYYRQALEESGFAVDEAINGIEAMEKVLAATPDLLIVDVNMPKMDGFALLRALRRSAAASVPVMMTSTEAGENDRAAARAAGANLYLVKPVPRPDLALHAAALTGRRG